MKTPSILLASALLLGLSIVWNRPGPTLLIGGDAGCYARVGRELAERPLTQWLELTLGHEPFLEHPPLGLWMHGLVVRLFGVSPEAQVWLARLYAWLTLLVLGMMGRTLGGARGAQLAAAFVLGALTLPGFLYESQVAMLEAPLTLALALGLLAIARMVTADRARRSDLILFAVATCGGFWVKGPPVLVLFGVVAIATIARHVSWKAALASIGAAVLLTGVTVAIFEGLRAAAGLGPFFSTYLGHQVFPSINEGRHNPDPNPFFYVGPTLRWYGPGVGALVLGVIAVLARALPFVKERFVPMAFLLGASLWLGVLVGFSIPAQKYQWYVHPGLVGAALMVGSLIALLPPILERPLTIGCFVAAALWPFIRLVPWEQRLSGTQRQTAVLQAAVGPRRGDAIADCSSMDGWVSGHLIGFLWDARRVDCTEPASWRFDGAALGASPP